MSRLIDADKRIAEIKKQYCTDCENYGGVKCRACWVDDAMCLIDDATTVDAVEVVRCRECKYHEDTSVTEYEHCCLIGQTVRYDDFCSHGKRKEGDGNG